MGECPDYRYFYDGHAPRAKDLAIVCREHAARASTSEMSHDAYLPLPLGAERPLVPFASAMALLPARCHRLLPEAVHLLMTDKEVRF